ncbi:MAG: hypothetical protein ABR989_04565 [Candidatus Binatus soli]|jgi:hypothetical protein
MRADLSLPMKPVPARDARYARAHASVASDRELGMVVEAPTQIPNRPFIARNSAKDTD